MRDSAPPARVIAESIGAGALGSVPPLAERLFGGTDCTCNVCGAQLRRFPRFATGSRLCPMCGSNERERFHLLLLERRTSLYDGTPKSMLHVCPEAVLEPRFREVPGVRYLTADTADQRCDLSLDVSAMTLDDDSFDLAVCSNVLQRVRDDRAAMSEFRRVVKPGGVVLFGFPVAEHPTVEDPSCDDRVERIRRFGGADHVRAYGYDVVDRLEDAGFEVSTVFPDDIGDEAGSRRHGLDGNGRLAAFLCAVPASDTATPASDTAVPSKPSREPS